VFVSNIPPEISAGDDQTVDAGTTVSFTGSATDPSAITIIEWDFDYDGSFTADATGTLSPTHQYLTPGDYEVALRVTDEFGGVSVSSAWITVLNVAPTGTVSYSGPADEGTEVTITIDDIHDPDPDEIILIYVDWKGEYEWELVSVDFISGSVSFTHTYDDSGTYHAIVWIEDIGGLFTSYTVEIQINNVAPTASFGSPGDELIDAVETIALSSIVDPSPVDTDAGFKYSYRIDGGAYSTFTEIPYAVIPNPVPGQTYTIEGRVQDKDGGTSESYSKTVRIKAPSKVVNNGTGSVELMWVGADGPYTLGPGESKSFDVPITGLSATLLTSGASYGLHSNIGFDSVSADGLADISLFVSTIGGGGLPEPLGNGDVGIISIPAGSSLSTAIRGDLGAIAAGAGSTAGELLFGSLSGSITGFDYITSINTVGTLGDDPGDVVQSVNGIELIQAYGIGATISVATNANAERFGTNVNVGPGDITVPIDFGNQPYYISHFNADGRPVLITDAGGNTVSITYDEYGYPSLISNGVSSSSLEYDSNGNLIEEIDADGFKREMDYDSSNRLLSEIWYAADGETVIDTRTFTYDSATGEIASASNNAGTYTYSYNSSGNLETETTPSGVIFTYAYDANDNVTSLTDSLGSVTTSVFDSSNRLISRSFSGPGQDPLRIDFAYTAEGKLDLQTRYSDLSGTQVRTVVDYDYDAEGRVTDIEYRDGSGAIVADYEYTYEGGLLVSQNANGNITTYGYDAQGQLIADGAAEYSYDLNGNRDMDGYVTGDNNRLLTEGTWLYQYDNAGHVVSKLNFATEETWSYTWNINGHLVSAEHRDAAGDLLLSAEYSYDAFGKRIEKQVTEGGQTEITKFTYLGADIVADLDQSGNLQTRYLRADSADHLFGSYNASGGLSEYLTDHLGSIRDVLTAPGTVTGHVDYDAWGNVINGTAVGRYSWTGREFDAELGLYHYLIARKYDPTVGRFLSQDPVGLSGDSNLYRYVRNQPTMQTDPSGLWGWYPEIRIGSVTLVAPWDRNASWNVRDNVKAYGTIAKEAVETVVAGGKTLLAKLVENFSTGVDTLKYVYTTAKEAFMVVGDFAIDLGASLGNAARNTIQQFATYAKEFGGSIVNLFNTIKELGVDFNGIITQIVTNPTTFLNNIKGTIVKGFEDFFAALPTELPAKVFEWVKELLPASVTLPSLSVSGVTSFIMQMFEVDWNSLTGKLVTAVGPENVALVTKAYSFIEPFITNPSGIYDMVQTHIKKALDLTPEYIYDQLLTAGKNFLVDMLPTFATQVAKKFIPGVGVLSTIYDNVKFIWNNWNDIIKVGANTLGTIKGVLSSLASNNPDTTALSKQVTDTLKGYLLPGVKFLANAVGLGDLNKKVHKALMAIKQPIVEKVDALIKYFGEQAKSLIPKLSNVHKGLIGSIKEFTWNGASYEFWMKSDGKTAVPMWRLASSNTAQRFNLDAHWVGTQNKNLMETALSQAVTAATAAATETRARNIALANTNIGILNPVLNTIDSYLEAGVCEFDACFAAGTPLLTPDGYKPIEQFKPGDVLISRSEFDPDGLTENKVVEQVFRRLGRILHLHVGGQVIRTTAEHPFYVDGKGWKPAGDLEVGNQLVSHVGQRVMVEDLCDTGNWETVYNLRVADYHTYFVGYFDWGFSVWSHNSCDWAGVLASVGSASVQLRQTMANLYKGGDIRQIHAHHIVPKRIQSNATGPYVAIARQILLDVGIDPYQISVTTTEQQSLARARSDVRSGNTLYNLTWAVNEDHSTEYARSVAHKLEDAIVGLTGDAKKTAVIQALNQIKTVLNSGQHFRYTRA